MKKNYYTLNWMVFTALAFVLTWVAPAGAMDVKVSGQVNQMVMYADDGSEDGTFITDNDNSSTRFRFDGRAGPHDGKRDR